MTGSRVNVVRVVIAVFRPETIADSRSTKLGHWLVRVGRGWRRPVTRGYWPVADLSVRCRLVGAVTTSWSSTIRPWRF